MLWIEQLQSAHWGKAGCLAFSAYLLGCFTTGYYLVRWRTGQDLRELGSGSVGARNVGRILGWPGFFLALLGDFSKGAVAVSSVAYFTKDATLVGLAMLGVVAGHIWPMQLRFHGGKGVATSLGALLVYDYHLAVAYALSFATATAVLRRTVLPGLFAFACLPAVSFWLEQGPARVSVLSCLAAVVLLAHRKNLAEEFTRLLPHRTIQTEQDQQEL